MTASSSPPSARLAAEGAVLGALVGDAAGGVLEFMGPPDEAACERALGMPGGGVFGLAPGQITDDGEMTVSLLAALAAAGGRYDDEAVACAYVAWAASHPFDIGMTTRKALHLRDEGTGVAQRVRSQAMARNDGSKANGSLMRATPLGVTGARLDEAQAARVARLDAQMTHPNLACQHSTAAYVLALRQLVLEPCNHAAAFDAAWRYADANDEEVAGWLADAATGCLTDAHPMAGFVRHAFTYAFHHLHEATSYRDALLDTLRRGGDTDTNACIVGGLIGALHGADAIPPDMRAAVLGCDTRQGQARPARYTAQAVLAHIATLMN